MSLPPQDLIQSPAGREQLLDRISELEEQVCNLKRLESTIERNTALFKSLMAAGRDEVLLVRLDGTIVRTVQSVLDLEDNVCGISLFDIVHPDDRSVLKKAHEDLLLSQARQVEHEVRVVRSDGSLLYIESTITDMLNDPAVLAVVYSFRDVTSTRTNEIAASELVALAAHTPFAWFSENRSGVIQTWNAGAEAMFGYTKEEILGEYASRMNPDPARQHPKEEEYRKIVLDGSIMLTPLRTTRLRKDGTLLKVDLFLAPLVRAGQVQGVTSLSYPIGADEPGASSAEENLWLRAANGERSPVPCNSSWQI